MRPMLRIMLVGFIIGELYSPVTKTSSVRIEE